MITNIQINNFDNLPLSNNLETKYTCKNNL